MARFMADASPWTLPSLAWEGTSPIMPWMSEASPLSSLMHSSVSLMTSFASLQISSTVPVSKILSIFFLLLLYAACLAGFVFNKFSLYNHTKSTGFHFYSILYYSSFLYKNFFNMYNVDRFRPLPCY